MNYNKYQVALIFTKTAKSNKWVYKCPIIYKDSIGSINKKKFYTIPFGKMKGTIIRENQLLEMNDSNIIKKYKSLKREEIRLNGNADSDNNVLFVTLGIKIKDEIYDELKQKLGSDLSEKDFLDYLVLYAHKIGTIVDSIEKRSLTGYSIIKKDVSIDDTPIKEKDVYILDDWVYDKPKEEKMEATYSYPEPSSTKKSAYNNVQQFYTNKNLKKSEKSLAEKKESEERKIKTKYRFKVDIDPIKIKDEIRKKVICQDNAIDMVVNNIYINQKIIQSGDKDRIRQKSTILLDGPTGTGKTFIIREATEQMGLPYVLAPSTSFSTTGYKGSDLTDILIKLLDRANGDIDLAQRGIIVIDEFDKLGVSDGDKELAIRKGMQHELLTFIEGAKYDVEYEGQKYEFDTSKITFIALGAFTNLRERKIAENEKNNKQTLGFNTSTNSEYNRIYTITADDYIDEGIGRELIGRFSCLTYTNELGVSELEKILRESESSPLKKLISEGDLFNTKIIVDEDIISLIAQMAFDSNTGARALNQICNSLRGIISNELVSGVSEIRITKEHLDKISTMQQRHYNERKH